VDEEVSESQGGTVTVTLPLALPPLPSAAVKGMV
jgi:hypothetical protein